MFSPDPGHVSGSIDKINQRLAGQGHVICNGMKTMIKIIQMMMVLNEMVIEIENIQEERWKSFIK